MPMMTQDGVDDAPVSETAEGFEGMDCASDPTLLPPGVMSGGMNVMCRGDGKARSRPGTKLTCHLVDAITALNYTGNPVVRGMAYYDIPAREGLIACIERRLVELSSTADNSSGTDMGTSSSAGTSSLEEVAMVQLVDTLFFLIDGRINYAFYSGGAWSFGTVTAFSDATAMPMWSKLVTQNFRLYAMEANGYKLYASAIGQATGTADWIKTDNIRVGSGEGDPARALVNSQARFLTMLNARSCWQIDTSDAAVANWSTLCVTRLTGCVEGKTAVPVGQDVFFLAREGVVNMGALSDEISISPIATLSRAIQPYIDRINWTCISKAFATKWEEFYILALPLDINTRPKHLFAFSTMTKRWQPPWIFDFTAHTDPDGASQTWAGFTCAVQSNFGDKSETLLADNVGRLFKLQFDAVGDIEGTPNAFFPVSIVTRAFTHGDQSANKQPVIAEVHFRGNGTTQTVDVILLRDGATETTSSGSFNTNADQIGGASLTVATGALVTKRLTARNLAAYRQACLQIFSRNPGVVLAKAHLHSFVDAPQITPTQ